MTRPSHSPRAKKLIEGLGDLRIGNVVGIGVQKIKHLKLHSKLLLADKSRAVIGSINLTSGSFDDRRELAIHVTDTEVLDRLVKIVHDDWRNSRALDLSDKVVLSDLGRHNKTGGLVKGFRHTKPRVNSRHATATLVRSSAAGVRSG